MPGLATADPLEAPAPEAREAVACLKPFVAEHLESWDAERRGVSELLHQAGSTGGLGLLSGETSEPARLELARSLGSLGALGIATGFFAHLLALDLLRAVPGSTDAASSKELLGLGLEPCPVRIRATDGQPTLDGAGPIATNLPGAGHVLLLCRGRQRPFEVVLLPVELPGLEIEPLRLVGLGSARLARLHFHGCRLPAGARRGPLGAALLRGVCHSAHHLGLASLLALLQRTLRDTWDFVIGRPHGEGKLSDLQTVRHRLASLDAELVLLRALVDEAAERESGRHGAARQASALATELAPRLVESCLQLHGGRGYLSHHPGVRAWRDTQTLSLLFAVSPTTGALRCGQEPDERRGLFPGPEHDAFRHAVRRLAEEEIRPHLADWERRKTLPRRLFRACGEAGLTGVVVPEALGGRGLELSHSLVLAEELVWAGALGAAVSLLLPANSVCPILARHGSEEAHETFLRPILRGEKIAALGVTEPGGGSAVIEALATTAEDRGDHWLLRGEKMFITNGPIADVVLVLARTAPHRKALSMTFLAVPTETPGFRVLEQHEKLGLCSSPTGWLVFEDCRVPKSFTVGPRDQGYMLFSEVIHEERLLVAASAVAIAERCLEHTARNLDSRSRASALAPLQAEADACRAFVRRAAVGLGQGRQDPDLRHVAKFAVCDRVQGIVRRCVEALGLDALQEDSWMARTWRDVRVLSVFAGTSETVLDTYAAALVREARLARLRRGDPSPCA